MESLRKNRIIKLLKGIETGDPTSVQVINPEKYIQHNPQTYEGRDGLASLFKQLSLTNPRVNIVRIFEDGDYIFAHTEYDFSQSNIGFEIFRFEDDMTVEHWDNIQLRKGPNRSGHTMIGGTNEIIDHDRTENNRLIIKSYVSEILMGRDYLKLDAYITDTKFTQHNPQMIDGVSPIIESLNNGSNIDFHIQYDQIHKLLAEGNFVLSVSEGHVNRVHSAIYDLYRLESGKIVEHWDTIEAVPPKADWKNDNGKF